MNTHNRCQPDVQQTPGVAGADCVAGTIEVTNNLDLGPGSLRAAFVAADAALGAQTICVNTTVVGPIVLTSGALTYATNPGALTLQGNGITISGNLNDRVINDTAGGSLTLDHVTIKDGKVAGNGGGVQASGPVTVTNSTISDNTNSGGTEGGGIYAGGAMTVIDSTFTDNVSSRFGGAVFAFGATVTNSTFTRNTSLEEGGAIFSWQSPLSVAYSTFSDNTSTSPNNLPSALFVREHQITLFASVLIKPAGATDLCGTLRGSISSLGDNFTNEDKPGSCNLTGPGDVGLSTNDPLLGALAGNGGPTWTRLPQAGSPLIDAIPNANCGDGNTLAGFAVTTDQRHLVRPEQSGGKCDIGAVEVQLPPAPAPAPAAPVEVVIRFTG